jgi:hypothetical protein
MNITSISYAGAQAIQTQAQPTVPARPVSANSNTDNSNSIANATSTAQQPSGPAAGNSSTDVTTNNAQQGSNPLANASAGIGTNLDVTA